MEGIRDPRVLALLCSLQVSGRNVLVMEREGGGSIVAVCPGNVERVVKALRSAGYTTIDPDNDREMHWTT